MISARASTAGCATSFSARACFLSLNHVRETIACCSADYIQCRSHSALGYIPPVAYAANLTAMRGTLGNPDQFGRPHIVPLRPLGATSSSKTI